MIGDRTYKMQRWTAGTIHNKNIYSNSFGYTETQKKVSAGSAAAVLAATATASDGTAKTVTSGITNPDVPRVLTVTSGGTTADILDGAVYVYGTNVEGKPINEQFEFAANPGATTVTGTKAFKTVTRVVLPNALSANPTFSVGTGNALGVNHRLFKNNTTVKVYSATAVGTGSNTLTLQTAPTVVDSENQVELNVVTPATTPDGSTFLVIAYSYDNWATAPNQDQPEYSTTTSTSSTSSSTSTTTATTTSTSTSSTSSSTSSTSSSTSSTSSSTSSTSTSTTTTP